MKSGGILTAVFVALVIGLSPSDSSALDLYYNNVDADLPGTGITPDGVWTFAVDGGAGSVFTNEVTETGGVNGSQSFRQTTDSTPANGTTYFFVRGFGSFAVFAGPDNLLAGGVAGSNNAAQYRFSMDIKISGNNGWEPTTPLYMGISQGDDSYEASHNIDVNGDGDKLDGADTYNHQVNPTISVSGQWVHLSFTFDQGTSQVDPDVLPADRVFSNARSLQWFVNYNSAGFNFDADNVLDADNFRIEFLAGQNGDYNSDGKVDAADYVVWRKNENTTNSLPNDNGIGGTVGVAHYNLWRSNFGNPVSGGGSGLGVSAVPEPTTSALAALIAAVGCSILRAPGRRRRMK